jgi:hypothetical protein
MRTITSALIVILIVLSSCITSRPERLEAKRQRKCELAQFRWGCNQSSDSIMIITETITEFSDTTIYFHVPADTVRDTLFVFFDDNGLVNSKPSTLETEFASSWAQVVQGKLYHDLVQKEKELEATIKDAIQKHSKIEYKAVVKTIKTEVNRLTGWQKFFIIIGKVFSILTLFTFGYVVIQVIKWLKEIVK